MNLSLGRIIAFDRLSILYAAGEMFNISAAKINTCLGYLLPFFFLSSKLNWSRRKLITVDSSSEISKQFNDVKVFFHTLSLEASNVKVLLTISVN